MKGTVFSIEEFSLFDGPGIRTTVFLKGCPLRCNWCHSPEGWSIKPQVVKSPNGCIHCGACKQVCKGSSEGCVLCGECISVCPKHVLRFSGEEMESDYLASKLLKNAKVLNMAGGGITFSGGECLLQADFLIETTKILRPTLSVAIQTSGYAPAKTFERVLNNVDLVLYDLKVMDDALARLHTGKDSETIKHNFRILQESGVPYFVRIPLIPMVTDTKDNILAILNLVKANTGGLQAIELMPYNKLAGSKYPLAGVEYKPKFDVQAECRIPKEELKEFGFSYKIL